MADIFDAVLGQSNNAPSGDIFDRVLSTKQKQGGEQTNEAQIRNEPETKLANRTQRQAEEQVDAVGGEANVQADGQLRTEDQGQRQRNDQASQRQRNGNPVQLSQGDIFDQVLSRGGELNAKQENVKAEDGYEPQVGQEGRQGIRSQSDEGNQAQVTGGEGGVRPPAQGNYLARLAANAEANPGEALTAAGVSAAETGVGLAAGKAASTIAGKLLGSVAAAIAAPEALAETAFTGGVGALAVPAIEMGAFAFGSYLGDKATQLVEKMIGADKAIEKAKQDNPELSQAASIATMVPMAASSVKNLASMAPSEAIKTIVGSGVGGAAFEPIRYGVESAIKGITGDEQEVKPITLESIGESALTGAILSAHGAREIENTVGPATARAAVETPTEQAVKAAQPTEEDATKIRKVQEGNIPEYQEGDQGGKATETSGGDRIVESGQEPQEVKPIILSAAFKPTEDSIPYRAKSHPEAIEQAVADGVITQEEADKYQEAENRNIPEFGFMVKMPDGKIEFKSRKEATDIASESGQIKEETLTPENTFKDSEGNILLHSNQTEQAAHKETQKPKQETEFRTGMGRPGAAGMGEFQKNRIVEASNAIYDVEKALGRDVKSGNEGDKRLWMKEMSKRLGDLNLSLPELNTLWNQSHEAYRIRNASPNRSIPIEKAVEQIAGNRIQSQRAIATNNEKVNAERAKLGLPPTLPSRDITQDSAWNEAAHRIHTNPQYLDELVSEFKTNPTRAANAEEQAALSQHMGDLQNRLDVLYEDYNKAETDAQKAGIDEKINQTIQDIDFAGRINAQAGTEWSGAGRMRAIKAAADFSLARRLAVEQKARGRKLTKEEARKVADETKEIEESNKRTLAAEEKARTANQENDIKSVINQGKKSAKKVVNADDLIEKSKNELAGRKDDGMALGSSIRNLAKGIVQKRLELAETIKGSPLTAEEAENATKVRDVVDETHKIVSGELGDTWSIKQTRDAISGYGPYTQPTKTNLSTRITALLGETRQIGKIEDIIKKVAPFKGPGREKPGAKQRMLQKRVNDLMREFGIQTTDPEKQLQGALDTARTRAKNAIEELEQIVLQGRKLDERTAKGINQLDPDLLDLKGEIAGLKQLIEDTYGKKEVPYEQKVAKMEKIYDNLIARYEREIKSGELNKTSSKGEPITSEKLEYQREILKNLRSERQSIRDADSIRQEDIKRKKLMRRAELLQKKIQGETLTKEEQAEFGPESFEVSSLRDEVASLEKQLEAMKPKKTEEEIRLQELQTKRKAKESRLAELQNEKKTVKGKDQAVLNEKQRSVQDEIDSLDSQIKQYQEAAKSEPKTEEQKAIDRIQKQLDLKNKQLSDQEIKQRGKKAQFPASEERSNLLKELESVKAEMQDQEWFQARQEALALQAYKNRLGKAIEENKRRLAENDFAAKERKPLPEDEEVRKLKAENNKLKDEQRMKIAKIEWENRTPLQKALDVSFKIKRAAVLLYLSTIEKLGATSIFIPAFRAPSALAGEVIGRLPVFKEIAKQARQEYGGRIDKEAAMYAKHYWEGIKEAKDIAFKLGRSELDMEYGDGSLIPTGALDVPGKIHEAIKYPTKLANYKLAYERYLEWGKRNGFDINNDAFKQKAGIEAYKEANSSIFLQDNKLVDKYNLLVTSLRKSKSPAEQAIGFALQESLPIVRIPLNIISEGLEYQFGLIPGLSKVIKKAMAKEIGQRLQDIEPEEADLIMRQLKKGSVGLMAFAIGAALPDFFGGFYRKDSQLDEEQKNFDGITIGGMKIDRRFLHHPAFFPFQIGATIRQVWDENIGDAETLGDKAAVLAKGAAAAQLGLIEEVPFVSFSKETGKMFDPTRLPSTAGEIVRSNIPGFIQETAASLDTNDSGIAPFVKALLLSREDVIKRKREGFIDNLKYGLPVFRQDLEEK